MTQIEKKWLLLIGTGKPSVTTFSVPKVMTKLDDTRLHSEKNLVLIQRPMMDFQGNQPTRFITTM